MTVRLLLLGLAVIAVALLVYAFRLCPQAPSIEQGILDDIFDLAWDHRDIEPALASALIDRIRVASRTAAETGHVLDELRELAWSYREHESLLALTVEEKIRDLPPPSGRTR